MELKMTLEQITANFTDTDKLVYKTPEIKFKSLEEANTKVISKV